MLVALCEQAAIASFVLGAVWYMIWSRQWMQDAGIEADENGRPKSGMGSVTYLLAFLAVLMVAGMMRHVFAQVGIDGVGKGGLSGLGHGLFVASPWIMLNNAFGAGRSDLP